MKKKTKHKKQQDATRPISENERVKSIMRATSNPEESNSETFLGVSIKTRHLRPRNVGETSDIWLDKKDSHIH